MASAVKISDHFDGERFFNPEGDSPKSFYDILKWKFSEKSARWPRWVELKKSSWQPLEKREKRGRVTLINHASVLLEVGGKTLLTDPVFSKRASPLTWMGPLRVKNPGLDFKQIPKVDVVLLSHNHYDHLDVATLGKITKRDRPLILAPLGDCALLSKIPDVRCEEMDWGDVKETEGLRITFCPSKHWSARGLFDRNKSLWGSYVIEGGGKKIYFAGDTGFGAHFKTLGERWKGFDVALLPIGAYAPRWFMKDHHMNPEEAVLAHQQLHARKSMAIHWGTFQLTDEALNEPAERLQEALKQQGLSEKDFAAVDNGGWFWIE